MHIPQHHSSRNRVATNVEISTKRGKTKQILTNVEKTWISVISMEKPWKFEIGVKEKTWIFQFLPIFVTNVEKTWFLGDFYGKIVENRGNLKHESSKKHANFLLFGKKQPLLGIIN